MGWAVETYPVRVVSDGNVPKPSILPHGTTGWDGQLGFTKWGWYLLGTFQTIHPILWYFGMGWTVGIYPVRVVPVGNIPKPSILSHGTMGWDWQLGFTQWEWYLLRTFLNRPSCPMVRRDGMDSWDLPSESGTCWERSKLSILSCGTLRVVPVGNVPKPSILSHGTMG